MNYRELKLLLYKLVKEPAGTFTEEELHFLTSLVEKELKK